MKSQDDIDSDISSAIERDDAETLRDIIRSSSMAAHESLGGWLTIASYCGKLSALKVLLELNANVNWKNDDGETPFSYACAYNQFESARILHEHGANVNSVHASGCTPLDIAVCRASPEFREWLKRVGATRSTDHDEWPWPPPTITAED